MITGLTIQNFRGFRDMTLEGLARVNLLVGDNGSGKTALLEAVFLAMSNSPMAALQLRGARGLPAEISSDTFGEFFTEGSKEATISTTGPEPFERALHVRYDPSRTIVIPGRREETSSHGTTPQPSGLPQSNVLVPPLVFRWQDSDGKTDEAAVQIGPAGVEIGSAGLEFVGTQLHSAAQGGQGAAASIFSMLDRADNSAPFIEKMKQQFPQIEVIAVQVEGVRPLLYARVAGQKHQRPLELHSGGMTRLALMLLSIAVPTTRIVLIDEIENGLHHARFRLLWQQVRDFAVRFDTQVFVTTHSLECLDAAADAMSEHPEDFALMRTVRTEDKGCLVGLLPGARAGQLVRSRLEVRG